MHTSKHINFFLAYPLHYERSIWCTKAYLFFFQTLFKFAWINCVTFSQVWFQKSQDYCSRFSNPRDCTLLLYFWASAINYKLLCVTCFTMTEHVRFYAKSTPLRRNVLLERQVASLQHQAFLNTKSLIRMKCVTEWFSWHIDYISYFT